MLKEVIPTVNFSKTFLTS